MMISGWGLRRIADPTVEPLSLAEAKAQCQVDADITEQDGRISSYIKAAREKAESYCRRSFAEQTWQYSGDQWPCNQGIIELPMGPIIAVESVSYLASDGTRTQIEGDAFTVDYASDPPRLLPAYNTAWPQGRVYPGSIQITYRAGYESSGSPSGGDTLNVPELAKQAIAMLVGHWFNVREDAIVGTTVAEVPHGFYSTLDPLRVYP